VASSSGRRLRLSFIFNSPGEVYLILISPVYYRVFNTDGAIATKRPAYTDDPYLGCIIPKWVAPPHHAGSLKNCLAAMENIDPKKTRLFATSSNKIDLADDTPVSLNTSQTLGLTPAEPLVLFCEVIPQLGLKPGTESLCVPPDAYSPLTPRFRKYLLPPNHVAQSDMYFLQCITVFSLSTVHLCRKSLLILRNRGYRG
jgi:hypothetical protein